MKMQTIVGLKWRTLSMLMSNPGRASKGIKIGYRYGFDSGEMLDYVYENRASGRYLIGPLIDRVYLNTVGWRAIRSRKQLLKTTLHMEIATLLPQAQAERRPLVILDVAAGPGRYLQEVYQEVRTQEGGDAVELQVICRDLDTQGLELGEARAKALGLTNMRYERGDAIDPQSLATVDPKPDIVVVSGLYELFMSTAPIRQSLQGIYNILNPGGTLIFTSQVMHPQLELIANVLVNREGKPWIMVCRSIEEAESLAKEGGFQVSRSQVEPLGLFGVTVCRKEGLITDVTGLRARDSSAAREQLQL